MDKKIFFTFFFSFLSILLLLSSISALDLNFVQNTSNPILNGSSPSSFYEPYYNGGNGLNIPAGVIKQWYVDGITIKYRQSIDGNNWTEGVKMNGLNYSTLYLGYNFSVKPVLNEFGHSTYYQMFIVKSVPASNLKEIYIFNSADGVNWTAVCLGNPIITSESSIFGDLDFFYTPFSYNVLVSGVGVGTMLYNSTALCSGWVSHGYLYNGSLEPRILYNSFFGVFSVIFSNASRNSFSMKQGLNLYNLTETDTAFFNIGLEQSYIRNADIVDIYDYNSNFSHKVYMYFGIDNNGVGVAYDDDNRQLNDILGIANETYNNVTINETITGTILGDASDYFSGLFPSSEGKETKTLLAYVFITLLLIDIVLFVLFFVFLKSPKVALWVILIFDTLLFFYFLSIGYIPIGILIVILLIISALAFFKFKGGGG
jgi:hypothetical protein